MNHYHATTLDTMDELYLLAENEDIACEIAANVLRNKVEVKLVNNPSTVAHFAPYSYHGYLDSSKDGFGTLLMSVCEMCATYEFRRYYTRHDKIHDFLAKYQSRTTKLKDFL